MPNVRWLGVAGLEIRQDDQVLLIDPYLSRPTKLQTLLFPLNIDEAAVDRYLESVEGTVCAIAVGHTHSDHVLDVPSLIEKTGAPALGTQSLSNLLSAYNMEDKAQVIEPGKALRIGPFQLLPIASVHGRVILGRVPFPGEIQRGLTPPLRVNKYRHGGPLVWHVTVGGVRLMQLGSADFVESNLEGLETDVLFVCAAGRQNTSDFARRLLSLVRPKIVVPFHFDDFSAPLAGDGRFKHVPGVDLPGFVQELRDVGGDCRVLVPEPFAPLELAF